MLDVLEPLEDFNYANTKGIYQYLLICSIQYYSLQYFKKYSGYSYILSLCLLVKLLVNV
jgi:hypothetical protein